MKYNLVNENFTHDYGENLLRARGVKDVKKFLRPDKSCLQDPGWLSNIAQGVELLHEVLESGKPIFTVVDCDCDGYGSAAILYQYIKEVSPNTEIDVYFHTGKQHGLADVVDEILGLDKEYGLCFIADAGSNDYEQIERLGEEGIRTICVDHHECDRDVSKYCILINNQTSPSYINKDLCGGGMMFQFCRYYDMTYGYNYADKYIDLAALTIISDMMDVRSLENRYIITEGLTHITNHFFIDIVDRQSFSMGGKVNPISIAFYIVPLINAMVRVGTQDEKERLFWAFVDGRKEIPSHKRGANGAMDFASFESIRECTNAKARQGRLLDQITARFEQKIIEQDLLQHKILFIELDDDDDFPSELNGLVAMRCCAKYKKPTIVARENREGEVKGSARAPSNSELKDLKQFEMDSGYFEWALGHAGAHGVNIRKKNVEAYLQYADYALKDIDFGEGSYDVNFVRYAAEPDLREVINDLGDYEGVWGQGNPEPLIYVSDLNVDKSDIKIMGKNQDTVKIEKYGISFIKFHAKDLIEELSTKGSTLKFNIIGKPNINVWRGVESPQLFIEDYEIRNAEFEF